MKRIISRLFVAAALVLFGGGALQAQDYTIVVNAANPAASLTKAQASDLLLKKAAKWPHGAAAQPVDQQKSAAVRDAASRAIHGRPTSAIASYWQQQIFAGKDVPPPEKGSDADVLAFVRSNPGAIGYVSAGADLGAGVKALTVK
ncbi:MAG TPA: substrate-binding domain-containing protein [Gemmatimonadales bacterium]